MKRFNAVYSRGKTFKAFTAVEEGSRVHLRYARGSTSVGDTFEKYTRSVGLAEGVRAVLAAGNKPYERWYWNLSLREAKDKLLKWKTTTLKQGFKLLGKYEGT